MTVEDAWRERTCVFAVSSRGARILDKRSVASSMDSGRGRDHDGAAKGPLLHKVPGSLIDFSSLGASKGEVCSSYHQHQHRSVVELETLSVQNVWHTFIACFPSYLALSSLRDRYEKTTPSSFAGHTERIAPQGCICGTMQRRSLLVAPSTNAPHKERM